MIRGTLQVKLENTVEFNKRMIVGTAGQEREASFQTLLLELLASNQRKMQTIKELASVMCELIFFKNRGLSEESTRDSLMHMNLQTLPSGTTVFEVGDEGNLFYYILEGKVEVRIPDSQHKEEYTHICQQIFLFEEKSKEETARLELL
jgi:hypothetical protein